MSFAMLPPEINSGRMYAGPGAGPLTEAAEAWDNLAAELYSTAQDFGSVVSGLAGASWLGPAAASMAAAAEPHVQWLSTTAARAEQTGAQAKVAAGAYAQAFAMTVPPAVVATNRAEYLQLVATNIFGQNSPAIGANEAQYAEYWAQDGKAMDNYAVNSTAATQNLATQHFTPLAQNAAAAQTQALPSPGDLLAPVLQQLLGPLLPSLQQLQSLQSSLQSVVSSPLLHISLPPIANSLLTLDNYVGGIPTSFVGIPMLPSYLWAFRPFMWLMSGATISMGELGVSTAAAQLPMDTLGDGAKATLAAGTATPAASADVGQASVVGGLSVPPDWVETAPAIRLATAALPTTSFAAIPGTGLAGGMPLFSGAPLVTMAARGVGGSFSTNRQQAGTGDPQPARSSAGVAVTSYSDYDPQSTEYEFESEDYDFESDEYDFESDEDTFEPDEYESNAEEYTYCEQFRNEYII